MQPGALFEIEFNGFKELQGRIIGLQDLLNHNLRAAVAETVLFGITRIALDTPVNTGLLKASIGGQILDTGIGPGAGEGRRKSLTRISGLTGVIGTIVEYAVYQEFGFTATGPKHLTPKQLRFLFATGILKRGPGGRAVPGARDVTQTYYKRDLRDPMRKVVRTYRTAGANVAINRRAGIRTHVKGRGFFRRNVPDIRQYFYEACQRAVTLALQGKEMTAPGA